MDTCMKFSSAPLPPYLFAEKNKGGTPQNLRPLYPLCAPLSGLLEFKHPRTVQRQVCEGVGGSPTPVGNLLGFDDGP